MQSPRVTNRAGWRSRRGAWLRATARSLTALFILVASFDGVLQRATSASCAGPTPTGAHERLASADPGGTVGTTTAAPGPGEPLGIPGEAPARGASCGGSVALAIDAAAAPDPFVAPLLPATRATAMIGADAPEPLLGPPRLR